MPRGGCGGLCYDRPRETSATVTKARLWMPLNFYGVQDNG